MRQGTRNAVPRQSDLTWKHVRLNDPFMRRVTRISPPQLQVIERSAAVQAEPKPSQLAVRHAERDSWPTPKPLAKSAMREQVAKVGRFLAEAGSTARMASKVC